MELRRSARIGRITDRKSQIETQGHTHNHYAQTQPPVVMPTLQAVPGEKLEVPRSQKAAIVEKGKAQGVGYPKGILGAQVAVGVPPPRLA